MIRTTRSARDFHGFPPICFRERRTASCGRLQSPCSVGRRFGSVATENCLKIGVHSRLACAIPICQKQEFSPKRSGTASTVGTAVPDTRTAGFLYSRPVHRRPRNLASKLALGNPRFLAFLCLQYVGSCLYIPTFRKDTAMPDHLVAEIVKLVKKAGILRPRDLRAHGIPRLYLGLAVEQGAITRVGRGLYTARGAKPTEHHSLAQASKRVPKGVVCLLSALRFHDLTTQSPFEVWLAIGEKARLPKLDNPPLRIVRFSQKTLIYGVQEHSIEGIAVRVYSPAKTVADCFRYRNKIGLDVALEALRECKRKRRATTDDIWKAAKACRVANVMRPYLESLQ